MGIFDVLLGKAPADDRSLAGSVPSHAVTLEGRTSGSPNLDAPLLDLADIVSEPGNGPAANPWTLAHAFEGTQIFGETGSGKTSGSGRWLSKAFLKSGFGGLVLTAKTNDLEDWIGKVDKEGRLVRDLDGRPQNAGFFRAAGREPVEGRDYVILGESSDHCFNFLEYERTHGPDLTHNLVSLFLTAVESGGGRESHEDAYWIDALRQLLTNAIDLVKIATKGLTLGDIQEVIQTAPQSREEARSAKWQRSSRCWSLLVKAETEISEDLQRAIQGGMPGDLKKARGRLRDFQQTINYWLLDFAGLADRTRSVVVSSFTAKSTGLTRWPLFDLLCSEHTVDIVKASREGKVVIINLPVKRYSELGRFAQVLLKTVWQRAIERDPDPAHPVFLWADEAQFFITSEDMLFQTTARSAGCATVYLTQNISNYYAVMNGRNGIAATDSLLGNLTTKIFHANGDPATNEWAARVFSKSIEMLRGSGTNQGATDVSVSSNRQQSIVSVMQGQNLQNLKRAAEAMVRWRHGYFRVADRGRAKTSSRMQSGLYFYKNCRTVSPQRKYLMFARARCVRLLERNTFDERTTIQTMRFLYAILLLSSGIFATTFPTFGCLFAIPLFVGFWRQLAPRRLQTRQQAGLEHSVHFRALPLDRNLIPLLRRRWGGLGYLEFINPEGSPRPLGENLSIVEQMDKIVETIVDMNLHDVTLYRASPSNCDEGALVLEERLGLAEKVRIVIHVVKRGNILYGEVFRGWRICPNFHYLWHNFFTVIFGLTPWMLLFEFGVLDQLSRWLAAEHGAKVTIRILSTVWAMLTFISCMVASYSLATPHGLSRRATAEARRLLVAVHGVLGS